MNDVKTLSDLFGNHRESRVMRLEEAARKAYAGRQRWTLWVRLSFAAHVSEITAGKHILNWATQFRRDMRGSAILVGLHGDTERLHAHALIFIPRRGAPRVNSNRSWLRGCALTWHQKRWPHGLIWLDRYSPDKHGAAEYLARDPGSVVQFGKAPAD